MRGLNTYVSGGAFAAWWLAAFALVCATPAQAQSSQAVVSAATQWQQTNTSVKRGARVQITAQGQWTTGAPMKNENAGPDGYAGRGSRSALLSSANVGALIGKIGPRGAPFLIGSKYAGEAAADGALFLSINDDANAFGDNQGRLSVAVTATTPPSAPTAAATPQRTPGGVSLSVGGAAIRPQAAAPAATTDAAGRRATTTPPATSGGDGVSTGGGITVRPQITIPLSAIFGRRPTTPSTAPSTAPSTKPPSRTPPETSGQVNVATATPPERLPPTRPPSTRPSTTPPVTPTATTPPTRVPPTKPPSTRPSVTPPVVTIPPVRVPPVRAPSVAPPVREPPLEVASTLPEPVQTASIAPPPEAIVPVQTPAALPEAAPPAIETPPPAAPPLIPAEWVMPAAAIGGGGALLLLFLLFVPKPKPGGKRNGKGAASVGARVVSDGQTGQALSVKWKGR